METISRVNKVKKASRLIILQVFLTIFAILMLLPFLWMISSSLKDNTEVMRMPIRWIPEHLKWENYLAIFQRAPLALFIFNSLKVSILSITGSLLFGSMAAYAFAKLRFKGRDQIFLLYLAMLMIPASVLIVPKYMLFNYLGLLDKHAALIIPAMFSPFVVFMMRQHMMGIPRELIEAAKVDGANSFYIYFRLVMPLCTSAFATLLTLTFIWSWNDFLNALVYLRTVEKYTITIGITTFNSGHLTLRAWSCAASIIAIAPVFILFLIGQRYVLDNLAMGAVKG